MSNVVNLTQFSQALASTINTGYWYIGLGGGTALDQHLLKPRV